MLTRLSSEQIKDAEVVVAQLEREFPRANLHDLLTCYRAVSPVLPTDEAQRFAEAAKRLRKKFPDASLGEVCDHFLATYRPAKHSVTLQVALENYLADVLRRRETNALSEWQFKSVGFAMQRLERFFGAETV